MDGRRQFGLGRRRQLEPSRRTGRKLGRHNSHRGCGRLGLDRDGEFDHRFVLPRLRVGGNEYGHHLPGRGHLRVDHNGGAGGTILNIGGTLTDSGYLSIGNATLSAPDEVTAAALDNTGRIYLMGSSADQALLDVAGSAGFGTAGVLSGYVRLDGDSGIEFASGEITSLAAGAHLGLVGSDAFIEDSSATGSNSALTGLASIGAGALFALHDGAAVSTNGALANDGEVVLDTVGGDGGSSLTLGGALTNSGYLGIGNATLSAPDEVSVASLDNQFFSDEIHLARLMQRFGGSAVVGGVLG